MVDPLDEIVWQPVFSGSYEFAVLLNPGFAKQMLTTPLSRERQDSMNKRAAEDLKNVRINCLSPYQFRNNSCFVSCINLGYKGLWLSTDNSTVESLLKNKELPDVVKYHAHNADTSFDAFHLMAMFSLWIQYSDVLLEK